MLLTFTLNKPMWPELTLEQLFELQKNATALEELSREDLVKLNKELMRYIAVQQNAIKFYAGRALGVAA